MFWKKKKNDTDEYLDIIGLSGTGEIKFSNSSDFLMTIGRTILCWLLTIGSICGYASCFSAQFNLNLVMIILAVVSFAIAYVKSCKSSFIKNAAYIIFFFVFTFTILRFYRFVNSGYHALVNLTYASLENYLDIPALVYYEEIIESSYDTITIFLIFLGIFELFIYHMWVSDHVNLLTIFLISFGPYIIPLFINLIPDDFYIICLMTAYIASIIICFCCHVSKTKKNDKYIVYRKINPWSKKIPGFSYSTNGLTYLMSITYSFVLALIVFAIITTTIPYAVYQRSEKISSLKASVMDEVKYLITFGLSGYFNRYSSTGGLNDGNLGGIYSVRPDYETDLTVTYVPLSSEPVYLRGYTGFGYTDCKWLSANELLEKKLLNNDSYNVFSNDATLSDEFYNLQSLDFINSPLRIDIKNIDLGIAYSYSPYYTNPELINMFYGYSAAENSVIRKDSENHQTAFFLPNTTRTYEFYPESYSGNEYFYSEKHRNIITSTLQVPSETRKEIIEFLEDNELLTEYIAKPNTLSNLSGDELQNVISQLSECLTNDFTYSLNPGITPEKEDFVGHFLNENKKGFCAHFATSAALIFRTLGIPTRYVEGYVITSEDLAEGKIIENADVSHYAGLQLIEKNLSVVEVNIGDDKAHAWVEYYDPDFGWRVFEATTASMESASNFDFWSSLYGFLNQTTSDESNLDVNNISTLNSATVAQILYRLLFVIAGIVLSGLFMYYFYHGLKQYRSYHRVRYNINVRNYYKIICKTICKKHNEFDYIISTVKQLDFIVSHYKLSKSFMKKDLGKLANILERAQFSNIEVSHMEYQYSMKMLKLLRRNIIFKI